MEAFKAEIIKEVRKEFQKMKQEIIDGMNVLLQSRLIFYNIREDIKDTKLCALYKIFFISSRENRTEQEIKRGDKGNIEKSRQS